MRKLLLLFAILATTSCSIQQRFYKPLPPIAKEYTLNTLKPKNYIQANEWMVEAFVSSQSVISFSDKEAGIVKGKYTVHSGTHTPGTYIGYGITTPSSSTPARYAIITIRVKDSLARLEIQPSQENYVTNVVYGEELGLKPNDEAAKFSALFASFEQRMGNDILYTKEFNIPKPKIQTELFKESKNYKKYLEKSKGGSDKRKRQLILINGNRNK